MAERRMFAKTIIDSDAFLDMPQSSQLLYFHLSMRADDEGFINNPKSIMRNVGCKDDDMKVLFSKKFVIPFESGIVVIKHWKIHNYIAKDRFKPTKYQDEKAQLGLDENNSYTKCIQPVYEMDTQVRLGKENINIDQISNAKALDLVPPINEDKLLEEEFDKLWSLYPKKQGKPKAKEKYIKYRKSKKDYCTYEEVLRGLENYLKHIKQNHIDMQYIKQGSTWFNNKCWLDEYQINDEFSNDYGGRRILT